MIYKTVKTCSARTCVRILFFIGAWLLLWLSYGDVLYQIQEQSLWIFASPKTFETLLMPSDILTYVSRFILTLFAIPWLGTLFMAVILSVTELLTDSLLRLKPSLMGVSYIPSIAMMCVLYSADYRIYCYHENAIYIEIILLAFIIIALMALTRLAISGKRTCDTGTIPVKKLSITVIAITVALVCADMYGARDRNFKTLATLKHLCEDGKWSKMARIAEKVENPNRPVAAYHAIAIAQLGQVGDRLFRIHHDYDNQPSNEWEQKIENGGFTFVPDITFYCGLTQPAYHMSMEQMIICGHYKHYLKVMIKATVLNKEKDVAEKLLQIVEKAPFEGKFVKRMRNLNANPNLIASDPEFAPVVELIPKYDSFEQVFGKPLFLAFYSKLSNGTDRALDLSLASCLYKKSVQEFVNKCGVLAQRNIIPKYFQEALVMICQMNNPQALQQFNISHDVYSNVTAFYELLRQHRNDIDNGKAALRKQFGDTYMYYNTFENLPKNKK